MESIDYRVNSYFDANNRHLIRGFFIGTKPNSRGWSISKDTINDSVKEAAKNLDLIYDPIEEDHIYSEGYDELIQNQKPYSRGKSVNIFGPFDWPDSPGDIYYDLEFDITDKPVSEALAAGKLPFALSPYIFPVKDGKPFNPKLLENRENIKEWIPAHVAIVKKGAFGSNAVIRKSCLGPAVSCHNALAASSEDIANVISSQLVSFRQFADRMDAPNANPNPETSNTGVTGQNGALSTQATNPIPSNPNAQAVAQTVPIEEFNKLKTEFEKTAKTNEKLVIKDRTHSLEKIFGSISDEETRNKVISKWAKVEDVDTLADFHKDLISYVVPSLQKQDAEAKKLEEEKKKINPLAASDNEVKEQKKTPDIPLAASHKEVIPRIANRGLTVLMGGILK